MKVEPNYFWELWSYAVTPVGHNETPEYMASVPGYLLEHQVGKEKPDDGDGEEA